MTLNNPESIGISKSKFYMLRCLIAMAHADGVFHDDEREYIENMMSKLDLSEEQTATLNEDMVTPQKADALFAQIEDPKFRGQVVYFAQLMAFKDGIVDPSEEDLIKSLHGYSTKNLDMEEIRANVKKSVQEEMARYDITIDGGRPIKKGEKLSFFSWFDEMKD
jgi:DnaJ-domain-containing protein 1